MADSLRMPDAVNMDMHIGISERVISIQNGVYLWFIDYSKLLINYVKELVGMLRNLREEY